MDARTLRLPLFFLAAAAITAAAEAAPPWVKIIPFKHVEADPSNSYPISENNGPWMIMATTFSGEGAEDQARQLVYELRKKYGLHAYTYEKTFDFSKGMQGRGMDSYGSPQRMKYRRGGEIEEIAVLIGDFESAATPEAQKALKKVKYATPDTLDVNKNKKTTQSLAGLRLMQQKIHKAAKGEDEWEKKGPMGHAFISTNPILPPEYFVPKGIDKLTLDMNKGAQYSLLDCPEKYTVKVATFTGQVVLDQKKIEQVEAGANFKSRLAVAAEKAHTMAVALREKGYEAYVFHDRYSSIVTVGAFSSVGTPRADGKIEINPNIHRIIQTFSSDPNAKDPTGKQVKGKSLVGIPFDLTPQPVEVPKRSLVTDYSRTVDYRQ